MKSRTLTCIAAMTFFAVLVMPVRLASHGQKANFRHYKLVDIGTFGGPMSLINLPFNTVPALNSHGITVGDSATSIPDPVSCGGNVFHAFEWQKGVVTDLSALPPANKNCSNASSVNANGEIAGTSEIDELDPLAQPFIVKEGHAVLWKNDKVEDLGTLGGNQSGATGINNRGQVVGGALNAIPDPVSMFYFLIGGLSDGTQQRAFLWQKGVMQDLGTLGGPDAFAEFVNERGQVAGFSYTDSTLNSTTGIPVHPFLWENGRMADLGSLGGTLAGLGSANMINGLNNRGEVIGLSTLPGDPGCLSSGCLQDVFLWNGERMIDLSTTTVGGSPILAFAINDPGEIVGAAAFPNAPFDAFLWRKGASIDLGHLNDCASLAFGINSHDQVVGGTFSCVDSSHTRAFLWENGTMIDLNALIPEDADLQVVEAVAINDRGEIAGNGVPRGLPGSDIFTVGHAFVLVPVCADGTEGCADAPFDPAVVAKSQAVPAAAPKPMTAEQLATFKERIAQMVGRNRGFGFWPRR
jgi:probable HAF family extracellular repeat protein